MSAVAIEPVLHVSFNVVAYDAAFAGYGDNRSREFANEQEAVAYARTIPDNYQPVVWKRITMEPISILIPHK